MNTRIIPTNKHGEVYYGPRTLNSARHLIDQDSVPAELVASDLEAAGYVGIAARFRKQYGVADKPN